MWLSSPLPVNESQLQRESPRGQPQESPTTRKRLESMVQAAHGHFSSSSSSGGLGGKAIRSDHSKSTNNNERPLSPVVSSRIPRTAVSPLDDDVRDAHVSLNEHMDSFPLVPLPVIPRLGPADLRRCESGLLQLLQSLIGPSASSDDAQLAKYASRQLSLVQRHLEQARARERVQMLLSGQVVVQPAPIDAVAEPQQQQQQATSAAKTLPIFLLPAPPSSRTLPNSKNSTGVGTTVAATNAHRPEFLGENRSSVVAFDPKSTPLLKTKKATLEAARALVHASLQRTSSRDGLPHSAATTTAFVIPAGDHSSSNSNARRRRRQQQQTKRTPTPAELEKMRVRQVEKEREQRRRNAYRRLLARQELQAAKKQQAADAKRQRVVPPSVHNNAVRADSSSTNTNSNNDAAVVAAASSDESDSSDVSNCSDSDEANERAIMALAVDAEAAGASSSDAESDVEPTRVDATDAIARECKDVNDNGSSDASADGSGCDDDMSDALEAATGVVTAIAAADSAVSTGLASSDGYDSASARQPECPEVDDGSATAAAALADSQAIVQNHSDDVHVQTTQRTNKLEAAASDADERAEAVQVAERLETFIATRRAVRLEQLQQQKQLRIAVASVSLVPHDDAACVSRNQQHDNSCRDTSCLTGRPDDEKMAHPSPSAAEPSSDSGSDSNSPSNERRAVTPSEASALTPDPTVQRPVTPVDTALTQTHIAALVRAAASTDVTALTAAATTHVHRPLVAPCSDYRAVFDNFHCILTNVFEQRRAFRSGNSSSSSATGPASAATTAASAYTTAVPTATHDQSLRLQLKLYEGWQSIMHDYATVFGAASSSSPSLGLSLAPTTAHYRINSTTRREVSDIVVGALAALSNWDEHPSGLGLKTTWNLLWTWSKPRVERQTLLVWQRVNHFAHAKALTRKDCLKRHLGRYRALGGRLRQAFDVLPLTFVLPTEYMAFVQAFQDRGERLRLQSAANCNVWIMKPVALSRGRGISLVDDLQHVVYSEPVVIQEYIANPLLLDGYKFDLRLYVLVTSFNPLEAFLYDEGFLRVCTRPYAAAADLSDLFVHLTNSSIQKENQDAIRTSDNPINTAAGEEAGGTKMTLAYLWKRLAAMGADVAKVRRDIDDVVLKSLLCGEDHIPFQVNSFDLLGYDILLDDTFRPWLIEINSSPSMARENALDYQVKDALILDTIKLVNPLRFDRAAFVAVVGRRLQDLESERRRPHAHIRHPKDAEEFAARQLNEDLSAILLGQVPRSYGELPDHVGGYRRICPHTMSYNQLVKLKKSCLRTERKA